MPRQALGSIRIKQRTARLAIGWIACYQIIARMRQQRADAAQITRQHANFFVQPIHRHGARGHVRHIGLNFHRIGGYCVFPRVKQQRNNARACAQVAHAVVPAGRGKICKQHRVRTKAKGVRALNHAQTAPLKIVDSFI